MEPGTRAAEIERLLRQAHEYALEYIATLEERPVFPDQRALEDLNSFDEPLPEGPCPAQDVLARLHQRGSAATVAQTAGRYFGFVNGGALPIGVAARWLGDVWDQNAAHQVMSPVAARLEEVCERWLVDLLQLPESTAAGFVTGTMMANFSAMAAARNELLRRQGWLVAGRGLYGAPPLRVVVSAGAHAAIYKSLSLLGLGADNVVLAPVDEQGRVAIESLPDLDERSLVLTQAGNVNSGAFDPVGEICERARAVGAWVHVDGAFGLWAGASRALRPLYEGVAEADSWALDAHKTLNAPYDSGIVLCRDRRTLTGAFEASAAYFQWGDRRDGMAYTPSMSRRARAVELWAILRTLGRSGVERLVDQLCAHARLFAKLLHEEGFQIHNDVVFNQVLVSCGDDRLTATTLERLQSSGECWCGGSRWNERTVIRISVCSWATSEADVRRSVRALIAARRGAGDAA